MSRSKYSAQILKIKSQGKVPVMPFWMLGDPGLEASYKILKDLDSLPLAGFELGVPFSDPFLDGPVVLQAHDRALKAGFDSSTLNDILTNAPFPLIAPFGLMSALNPIYQLKIKNDSALAAIESKIDSLLLPELPLGEILGDTKKMVLFLSPGKRNQKSEAFLEKTLTDFEGPYIYVTGYLGTTGKQGLSLDLRHLIERIKLNTYAPIVVGFGITDRTSALLAMETGADAVVVGSALIKAAQSSLSQAHDLIAGIIG